MKRRVLVIDGYEGIRRAMEYCLAKDGFAVMSAESAVAALAMVRAKRVDVILLDAMHSFAEGLEGCRLLKAQPECADVVIVLLADRAEPAWCDAARKAGAVAVMPKLFDWPELLSQMERAVAACASGRGVAS